MTRRITLLPRAERALDDIFNWTVEQFGPAQAKTYIAVLRDRLFEVADGTAYIRKLALITGNPEHQDVYALRAGEHFLIVTISSEEIVLLDIRHTRSNPATLLRQPELKD